MDWKNDSGIYDFTGNQGFIYRVDFTDGTCYFGKKNFISVTKKKFGKKELENITDKRKKTYHTIVKESDWRTYEGSAKDRCGRVVQRKTILALAKTKGRLTYLENKILYEQNVLLRLDCLNNNISGKIFATTIGREPIKWSVKCV